MNGAGFGPLAILCFFSKNGTLEPAGLVPPADILFCKPKRGCRKGLLQAQVCQDTVYCLRAAYHRISTDSDKSTTKKPGEIQLTGLNKLSS